MQKPKSGEYAPFYAGYVEQVPGENLVRLLDEIHQGSNELLTRLSEEEGNYRYAEGKWSIKELLQHLIDTERVMAFRALAFARGDQAALPGFDENDYAAAVNVSGAKLQNMVKEFDAVRKSTILFFKRLSEEESERKGIANGVTFSVRAIAAIIIGHEIHHMRVLIERYLSKS